jgi:hypothetical protein
MGECLHAINALGGKVVSVTTDGFITNISDLESKISDNYLISEYKRIRSELSGDSTGLELKSCGYGVMAWSTRGQIGYESKILATTGFQNKVYKNRQELLLLLESVMTSECKTLEYVQGRLRSASDIYKQGGNVTKKYRDQLFRLHYDNRRLLNWESSIPPSLENLIDSNPHSAVTDGKNLRFIGSLLKKNTYGKYLSGGGVSTKYADKSELAVRNFVKGLVSSPPKYNLPPHEFITNIEILDYVKRYKPELKLSVDQVSLYKNRVVKLGKLQKTKQTEEFVNYVLKRFPCFDTKSFYLSDKT